MDKFVSLSPNEIIRTLDYLREHKSELGMYSYWEENFEISDPKNFELKKECIVQCSLPWGSDNRVKARVHPEIVLDVDINAIEFVKGQAENKERMRCGSLYFFDNGIGGPWHYYVPKEFMEGIQTYDWNQYKEELRMHKQKVNRIVEVVSIESRFLDLKGRVN